jgi:hypothetical protein
MKKTTLFLVLLVLLAGGVPALADGKFYGSEEIVPEIPYQRALLLFDGEQETLVLQSKYDTADSATADSLGWVVPVPSVPELASMDADLAASLFAELYARTRLQPGVNRSSYLLLLAITFVPPIASILTLLACWLSLFVPRMRFVQRHRKGLIIGAFLALLPSACGCLGLWMFPFSAWNAFPPPVEVIEAEQVGVYDVQVVKVNDAGDLIEWLDQNRFRFDEEDTQAFDQYLQRGWCFVAARIDPSSRTGEQAASGGLAAPLIMRFQAQAPVYPLALTATSGHETRVLLYVLSDGKWQNDGRLALHYAGRTRLPQREDLLDSVEPEGFFSRADLALPYLCRFGGRLTPEEMREDLVFTRAEDNKPYPKRIFIW